MDLLSLSCPNMVLLCLYWWSTQYYHHYDEVMFRIFEFFLWTFLFCRWSNNGVKYVFHSLIWFLLISRWRLLSSHIFGCLIPLWWQFNSVFSDGDEDEDDTEALLAELERIKKERAEEKLRKVCACYCLWLVVMLFLLFNVPFVWVVLFNNEVHHP